MGAGPVGGASVRRRLGAESEREIKSSMQHLGQCLLLEESCYHRNCYFCHPVGT